MKKEDDYLSVYCLAVKYNGILKKAVVKENRKGRPNKKLVRKMQKLIGITEELTTCYDNHGYALTENYQDAVTFIDYVDRLED